MDELELEHEGEAPAPRPKRRPSDLVEAFKDTYLFMDLDEEEEYE